MDQRLLPPKKMLGKNSRSLVELRQKELQLYLQTLLLQFPAAVPTPLASFLLFHLYVSAAPPPGTLLPAQAWWLTVNSLSQEMEGITAALAKELFYKGWFPSRPLLILVWAAPPVRSRVSVLPVV